MRLRSSSKAILGLSILLGASALGAGQVGCSSNGSSPSATAASTGSRGAPSAASSEGSDTGTIGLALVLPGGDQINSVSYTLTNSSNVVITLPTAPNPGTFATNNSQSIEFQLGGVPAGSGYTIALAATTTQGATCQGSASGVAITARASTNVTIQLLCTAPGTEAGNLFVTGATSYCGTWTALSSGSNGSEVLVGQTMTLTVTAAGEAPSSLGYTWSQSSEGGAIGTFGSNQSEDTGPSDTNTFTCTAPGTATITVVVDDGPVPDGSACPSKLSTVATTVVCDPNPANDGG
jgi:hypothetical protein